MTLLQQAHFTPNAPPATLGMGLGHSQGLWYPGSHVPAVPCGRAVVVDDAVRAVFSAIMGPIDVDNVPVVGSILDDSHKAVLYYAVDIGLLSEKDLKSWWPNVFTDKAEIQSLCKPTGLEAVVYGPDGGLYYALANGKTQLTGGGCFEDVRGGEDKPLGKVEQTTVASER